MEYPVWQLSTFGGGFWIAVIAVTHVFVSHFAVGGGLFLVLTEMSARKKNSAELLDFVRRHTGFFLILTMVFGGLSGVSIWFTISVLAPGATSTLIHTFVWGWATEWVFFVGEITALLIYHYSFERMAARPHIIVGWLYFAFAWLSLFIINGVVGFMLTPGQWLASGNFWDGFLNPTFWPSLVFRTLLAVMLAGLFGFCTSLRLSGTEIREQTTRMCARWALFALPFLLLSGWWYLQALPPDVYTFITLRSQEITPYYRAVPFIAAALMIGSLLMAFRLPRKAQLSLAAVLLAAGFAFVGSFEFIREAGRKPWIIHRHTWSQGVMPSQVKDIRAPFLPRAKWAAVKDSNDKTAAGRELFALQCLACHSIGGPMNSIHAKTANVATVGMEAYLTGQGRIFKHMPPFLGDAGEIRALAEYVTVSLNRRKPDDMVAVDVVPPKDQPAPSKFDIAKDRYVLLAWNTLGMKCISDGDAYFSVLPPGNALGAVLIERGLKPRIVSGDEADLTYEAPSDFKKPSSQVDFWKYAPSLIKKTLPDNVSAAGKGMDGKMDYNGKNRTFQAIGIPVVPFTDSGEVNPYPLFLVTAKDRKTGRTIAQTKVVAPVSSEMGCRSCHGGEWRKKGVMGISAVTAENILKVHDRRSGTSLQAAAAAGKPVLCQSCHPDPLLNAKGDPKRLVFPAAMHAFHAVYLAGKGHDVCARCHPDSPTGVTRCARDKHSTLGFGCVGCHGYLEDHALSLLKKEKAAGNARAGVFMELIKPRSAASVDAINPRTPWVQEPDCMNCHNSGRKGDFKGLAAFNTWVEGNNLYRNRRDARGALLCIACHGAPHAVFPTVNAYGKDLDNLQSLQYMGHTGPMGGQGTCAVCHTRPMPGDGHH